MSNKRLRLFFWSSKIFENRPHENYGDLLSQFIVEKVSGRETTFYNAPKAKKKLFKKQYLMGIGSILRYASPQATVWGSGIISQEDSFGKAQFCAVRGPLSRKRIQQLGYDCPEVYGDPAILLPQLYTSGVSKKYKIGIVPHYVDYPEVYKMYAQEEDVSVIDLLSDDVFATTDHIVECECIVSSSLHGIIVAHAYGIPAIWVRFSDRLSGDNTKYADYFMSVGVTPYTGEFINELQSVAQWEARVQSHDSLPLLDKMVTMQNQLNQAFPKKFRSV